MPVLYQYLFAIGSAGDSRNMHALVIGTALAFLIRPPQGRLGGSRTHRGTILVIDLYKNAKYRYFNLFIFAFLHILSKIAIFVVNLSDNPDKVERL